MIKLNIIRLGHIHQPINWKKIESFQSNIFKVDDVTEIPSLSLESNDPWYQYSDDVLREEIAGKLEENKSTINVLVTKVKLENNWYVRVLNKNTVVVSLYEVSDYLSAANILIENFIIKVMIKVSLIQQIYKELSTSAYDLAHEETRGCLFDMNNFKYEVIHNTNKVSFCSQCSALLDTKNLPRGFKKDTEKDLGKLKKEFFYVLSDFVKTHPLLSVFLTGLFGIIVNTISSLLYDVIVKG